MGTRIEAVATAGARGWPFANGALRLSDTAARTCLERADRGASELDLLVNAGLYKEHNMAEPALASIIQEDIGANPGHPSRRDHHGTFSFDVMNGGCGALSALHLVDAFVGAGTAKLGLIVAGDADPSPHTTQGFPFAAVGGAVLLKHVDGREGFGPFEFRTFPELADLFEVRVEWEPEEELNVLEVREDPLFARRCLERAADVTTAFLARAGLRGRDVDLLVASQYPLRFGDELASAIDLRPGLVPCVRAELLPAHTAGPIAALEAAFESGAFARARRVLFVTAGSGITIGVALYERP
jgi:3-oxoacyl-[acyl-carrier-protein] synthase-3